MGGMTHDTKLILAGILIGWSAWFFVIVLVSSSFAKPKWLYDGDKVKGAKK